MDHSFYDRFVRFLPVDRYGDEPSVCAALHELVTAVGVRHWLLAGVPLPAGQLAGQVIANEWPEAWTARYLRERLWTTDPVFAAALGSRTVVRQDRLASFPKFESGEAVLQGYEEHGLTPLTAVPTLSTGEFQTVAILSRLDLDEDATAMFAAVMRRLVARLWHVAPHRLARHGQLTPREREIVGHTARGKTSNEIGRELGISARTVFAHLTSAGEKLRAANKTETVVNAFRYGQISL